MWGVVVAILAMILLFFGWRAPAEGPLGPRDLSPKPEPAESTAAKPAPAPAAAPAPALKPAPAAEIKPSATLAGQQELAEKKGEWSYHSGADSDVPAAGTAADSAAPAEDSAKPAAAPTKLDGPRDGEADDLKQIKGVGPKMEQLLNSMGFYHFDQVGNWTDSEVAWVDDNLEGFKGRVSRDNWVDQAKLLAAGGETEFSKKVDRGGVY